MVLNFDADTSLTFGTEVVVAGVRVGLLLFQKLSSTTASPSMDRGAEMSREGGACWF